MRLSDKIINAWHWFWNSNGFLTVFGRPAVMIITFMVLINAGIFFYFDNKAVQSDQNIQHNIVRLEEFAKTNRAIVARLDSERAERTDQNCKLFELDHLQDVRDLRDTYKFLSNKEAATENPGLTRFIILNLPRTEKEAKIDSAPEYCDDPGLGLPEPDPVIPNRPDNLDELTKLITPIS